MPTNTVQMRLAAARGSGPNTARLPGWLKLIIGFACIWAFMFVLVPAFDSLPGFKTIITSNKDLDIKATALFYSDAEETSEAQNYWNNSKGFLW
jgi:hypothetical protein